MQELVDARAGFGAAEADRDEVGLAESFFKDIVELLFGDVGFVAVVEIFVHQVVLHLHDLFDDRLVSIIG